MLRLVQLGNPFSGQFPGVGTSKQTVRFPPISDISPMERGLHEGQGERVTGFGRYRLGFSESKHEECGSDRALNKPAKSVHYVV